jgi:hypothetical protein
VLVKLKREVRVFFDAGTKGRRGYRGEKKLEKLLEPSYSHPITY